MTTPVFCVTDGQRWLFFSLAVAAKLITRVAASTPGGTELASGLLGQETAEDTGAARPSQALPYMARPRASAEIALDPYGKVDGGDLVPFPFVPPTGPVQLELTLDERPQARIAARGQIERVVARHEPRVGCTAMKVSDGLVAGAHSTTV